MSINERPKTLDFSSLDLIPQLLEEIKSLRLEIDIIKQNVVPKLDLTTRDGVKKYLGISESSLSKKMQSNDLINGIHYKREINGKKTKITFVELAIKNYKRGRGK